MPAYEADRFDPAAPLAFVTVKSERLGIEIPDVPMLIDTGADVSLLPRSYVESFISPGAQRFQLEGFDGTKSTALEVTAVLHLLDKRFRGQFLVIDSWYGILGRNILNNLSIVLDGPSQTWTVRG